MKCKNILETIGRTPLVRLNRMTKDFRAEVYVKADFLNPGGSVKDAEVIAAADERGLAMAFTGMRHFRH